MPAVGFSQYLYTVAPMFSYFKDADRWEIGGNGAIMMSQYFGTMPTLNQSGGFKGDTTIKRSIMSQPGFGGTIGLSLPVARIGHISMAAVSVHLMFNSYIWQDLNSELTAGNTVLAEKPALDATTTQICLPVSFDYKIGTDAICTKRLPFGASVGAGLMPEFSMTALNGVNGINATNNLTVSPFFKLEGAVFAGICIKLRVQVSYGDLNLMTIKQPVGSLTDGPFSITGNANVIGTLILMPFSGKWGETGWWNTHDTYNPYDKLN